MNEENQPDELLEQREIIDDALFRAYEWEGRQVDWFLQETVDVVNESSMEIGITLTTASGLISGMLISPQTYFKLYAEAYAGAFDSKYREDILKKFLDKGKSLGTLRLAPQFIHLRDAFLHNGGNRIPTTTGLLWRGKISSVSGFTLGSFGAD